MMSFVYEESFETILRSKDIYQDLCLKDYVTTNTRFASLKSNRDARPGYNKKTRDVNTIVWKLLYVSSTRNLCPPCLLIIMIVICVDHEERFLKKQDMIHND